MAKVSPIQPTFQTGEIGPKIQGRVDNERHRAALAKVQNYIPVPQGPLLRRPGTKFSGATAKDPSKPPTFLDFQFSDTQNYILEFGDFYIRFYTNQGQITTTSTHFKVFGNVGMSHGSSQIAQVYASSNIYAMRSSPVTKTNEVILASSVIAASSILEIASPYSYLDVQGIKVSQKDDTMYIVCSSLPVYKLQRFGHTTWDLGRVNYNDGPYLPLNSYNSLGDSSRVHLITDFGVIGTDGTFFATTGPRARVSLTANNGNGEIQIQSAGHPYVNGQRVVIEGVAGTTEANNNTSSISATYWTIKNCTSNTFDLDGSAYVNAYVGSGFIYPALFEPHRISGSGASVEWSDLGRAIAFVNNTDAGKRWGHVSNVRAAHRFDYQITEPSAPLSLTAGTTNTQFWYLGVWNRNHGFPQAIAFHQDRKFLAGCPAYPAEIDGSYVGQYENFSPSGSSFAITDANAIQRTLTSSKKNPIVWLKSDTNGLLAGATDYEWKITPSNQAAALTPTNFNAAPTGNFGSYNADSVQAGHTSLYIQKGQRRIRELNYFYQVDTYRSTDLAELADHITSPGLKRLAVQKESVPVVWGLRTDGKLISMSYSRDDVSLQVGWAQHVIGGKSDSAATAPVIKTLAVIPSPDGTYDNLWMAVQRYINGTSVLTVEYMADHFEDDDKVENAFYVDCGGSYDNPITVTGIASGTSAIVTTNTSHLLVAGDAITVRKVVGLNSSVVDADGNTFSSSLVNYRFFTVGTTSATTLYLKDYESSEVNPTGYSSYFSGGEIRKLVQTISGATWLKNETVSVLADGKIHNDVIVNSAGVFTLEYPAATIQFGYKYKSQGRTLRRDAGSQDGSAIGKRKKPTRAAFMLHNVGEIQVGPTFERLSPINEVQTFMADVTPANTAGLLFSGVTRDSLESRFDFDGQISFEQSAPLPGMVQTVTVMMETNDV